MENFLSVKKNLKEKWENCGHGKLYKDIVHCDNEWSVTFPSIFSWYIDLLLYWNILWSMTSNVLLALVFYKANPSSKLILQ